MERVDRREWEKRRAVLVQALELGSTAEHWGVTAEKGFQVDAGKLPVGQEDSMHFRKGFWEPREENFES